MLLSAMGKQRARHMPDATCNTSTTLLPCLAPPSPAALLPCSHELCLGQYPQRTGSTAAHFSGNARPRTRTHTVSSPGRSIGAAAAAGRGAHSGREGRAHEVSRRFETGLGAPPDLAKSDRLLPLCEQHTTLRRSPTTAACRSLPPPAAAPHCRLVCRLARQLASWDGELQRQLQTLTMAPSCAV